MNNNWFLTILMGILVLVANYTMWNDIEYMRAIGIIFGVILIAAMCKANHLKDKLNALQEKAK